MTERRQLVERLAAVQQRVGEVARRVQARLAAERGQAAALEIAHTQVANAETAGHAVVASLRETLIASRAGLSEALEQSRVRIESTNGRLAVLLENVSADDSRLAFTDLVQGVREQLESLNAAVGEASSGIEDASSGLEEGTGVATEAVADFLGSIDASSQSTRLTVHGLLAGVRRSIDDLQESCDDSTATLAQERSSFRSFLATVSESVVRGPAAALGDTSRSFVQDEIHTKSSDGVRLVVEVLIEAARSLRENGADMRSHREEAATNFERIGSGVSRNAHRADHVVSEADRVRREQEENGEGGDDV